MTEIREAPVLPFQRNEHGHYIAYIVGEEFSGLEESLLLRKREFPMRLSAERILQAKGPHCYDELHRLDHGVAYRCALVPYVRIPNRSTAGYLAYGASFGYREAKASMLLRLINMLSFDQLNQLKEAGHYYIAPPVSLLKNSRDEAATLCIRAYPYPDKWALTGTDGNLSHEWRDSGILMYEIP